MNPFYRILYISFLLALALSVAGQAVAQVVPMSLSEMTAAAQSVIHGKVMSTECKWINDERGNHIYTLATLQVDNVLKGIAAANPLQVSVPGGRAGEITEWVSHSSSLTVGEEVVLFLDAKHGDIIGGYQGKLAVSSGNVYAGKGAVPLDKFIQSVAEYVGNPLAAPALDAMGSDKAGTVREKDSGANVGPVPEPATMARAGSLARTLGSAETKTANNTPASLAKTNGWQTILSEDFEGTFPSGSWALWYSSNPEAYWDDQNYLAHGGSKSAWCAQGGANGLPASGGQYVNKMNAWMVYGPFSLSDAGDAEMTFWFNLASESGHDYFKCMASTNGTNFSGYQWSGNTGGWASYSFDLANVPSLGNLTGQSQVWVAFIFSSDNNNASYAGAFVDDVVIQKFVGTLPSISGITPSKASAGTDAAVTITGSNFGATQGSGTVNFFYKDGQPTIPGTVTSWSNTEIACTVPTGTVNSYPASAGSGPVTVTSADGGTSAGYQFRVSFGYGGNRWPGTNPTINYYINENYGGATGEAAQVQAAADRWSNAGAWFTLHYAGTTPVTSNTSDGINEVMWGPLGTGILGQASVWWNGSGLTECDFTFSTNYAWSTDDSPGASEYDVQSIAVHEMGHWLFLRDLYGDIGDGEYDVVKIMYGFGSPGTYRRNLHADDVAGIRWIYGASGLPVQISSMSVVRIGAGSLELRWTTLSETQNYGFQVERSAAANSGFVSLADGFIPGHGTTAEIHNYSYTDATAGESPWYYRIRQIDLDGSLHYTEAIGVQSATGIEESTGPLAYALEQNWPNPFNPVTTIKYTVGGNGVWGTGDGEKAGAGGEGRGTRKTVLVIYDLLGRQVATLVDDEKAPGSYEVRFDGDGLSSGVYIYRLTAGDFVASRKMTLLK